MKCKLIGTDFDGTLLTDTKRVTKDTINAIENARNNGIITVAVTGRTIESAKNAVDINIFDYIILNNGATIYDIKNRKILYDTCIEKEIAKEITKDIEKELYQIDYCTLKNYYIYKGKPAKKIPFIIKINDIKEVEDGISKINIFIKKQENINSIYNRLASKYKNVKIIIMQDSDSEKQWIVITPKNLSKKTAIEFLSKYINIKLEDMTFFGDGLNDIEIIETVGNGVAMGNALETVKKKAKSITKTNNEDGIAYYINKYIIKSE